MAQHLTWGATMANVVSSVPLPFHLQLSYYAYDLSYADDYSLVVALNPQLRQLDLSSLETISGGGLFYFNNPRLCYVGNFSTYLDNPTAQHQCVVSPFRKDPQTCCECAINHHTVSLNYLMYIQKLTE